LIFIADSTLVLPRHRAWKSIRYLSLPTHRTPSDSGMPDSKLFRDTRRSFCLAARWIVHYRHCTIDGALRLRSTAYDDGWVQRVGWRITLMAHHVDGVSPWTVQRVGRCSAFDGAARWTVHDHGWRSASALQNSPWQSAGFSRWGTLSTKRLETNPPPLPKALYHAHLSPTRPPPYTRRESGPRRCGLPI